MPNAEKDDLLRLFCGTAHPDLGRRVAEKLECFHAPLQVRKFADGEIHLVCPTSVRGCDVFVLQPTCQPVNDSLLELLITLDALKRASARHVTAVIPYYGYARQEKKDLPREPISARLVADLLETAGADRIMVMDLHAGAVQGFFRVPVDHLTALPILARRIRETVPEQVVVVSPDEGGVKHARRFAELLKAPLAVVYAPTGRGPDAPRDVAGDVRGKIPVIVEDMVATGSSVLRACEALLAHGCTPRITVAATHGLFVNGALERLLARGEIEKIIVTDTVPPPADFDGPKLDVCTVAGILSEAIRRAHCHISISQLFNPDYVY